MEKGQKGKAEVVSKLRKITNGNTVVISDVFMIDASNRTESVLVLRAQAGERLQLALSKDMISLDIHMQHVFFCDSN